MAGNDNIHVLFDYQNIVLVDPNKIDTIDGEIKERLTEQENLVMYANLEAKIIPRTKLVIGDNVQDTNRTISVARINFLKPNNDEYITNGYVDEITGNDSLNKNGVNQNIEEIIRKKGQTYIKNTVKTDLDGNTIDNGLLGITQISIKTGSSFVPTVSIELEDVQGKALFGQGDQSPYAAFYNLPYPPFYLTIKGFYGKAVRYELVLNKFNARYNITSGNYQITLELLGYKYNILNEITLSSLFAVPHMYPKKFQIKTSEIDNDASFLIKGTDNIGNINTSKKDTSIFEVIGERGYQKIIEVYKEYKAKKLIDSNFPELTVLELVNKLDLFEQNILNAYAKVDVGVLTDARNHKTELSNYYKYIRSNPGSWFNVYINPKPFFLKGSSEPIYRLKDEYINDIEKYKFVISKLKDLIKTYNDRLNENESFGLNKKHEIKIPISYDTFIINIEPLSQIDWESSYISQTGKLSPYEQEYLDYSKRFIKKVVSLNSNEVINEWFVFDGLNSFSEKISSIENQFNTKISAIETNLSLDLANKIEDKNLGIGFKPTIRNVIAVIMASTEAFIRLMDDVHNNAWNVRFDKDRNNTVLNHNNSIPGSDNKNLIKDTNNPQEVYPWPQVFVEKNIEGENRFQLTYPGDSSIIRITKANIFSKWPEVEFVEEYLRALVKKYNTTYSQDNLVNENNLSSSIIFNPIEFPLNNNIFTIKEDVKFFYELWERHFLSAHYFGSFRLSNTVNEQDFVNIVSFVESINVTNSLSDGSPFLISKLKEYLNTGYNSNGITIPLNQSNFLDFLRRISNNGTGSSYQNLIRDKFVTSYISNYIDNSSTILTINDYLNSPKFNNGIDSKIYDGVNRLLKSNATDNYTLNDFYPYRHTEWVDNNLYDKKIYDTTLSLKLNSDFNLVSNFYDVNNFLINRPVSSFSYLNVTDINYDLRNGLDGFYGSRTSDYMLPTEGFINSKTISLMNTPYFVNAIQEGVNKWRSGSEYPYVAAAYLFINSLPLSTISHKYKNYNGVDGNYIFSTLSKFSGLHKLPYIWILKYGSIWHRYKKYKTENIDIISDCWDSFNYSNNFDPTNNLVDKEYNFSVAGDAVKIYLQKNIYEYENIQTIIQPGFYPKLINDFNVLLNGYDLYSSEYTEQEIQNSIDRGLIVVNIKDSNISLSTGVDSVSPNRSIFIKPWTVAVPLSIDDSLYYGKPCAVNDEIKGDYYILPSFGSKINETLYNCFDSNGKLTKEVLNNNSMYDGSVRLFWGAPNYGYFDGNDILMPQPDEYLISDFNDNKAFNLSTSYSKIEDIFSIFDKKTLDLFENEFLNYSKSIYQITTDSETTNLKPIDLDFNDKNSIYRNFQLTIRNLLSINANKPNPNKNFNDRQIDFIKYSIDNQVGLFHDKIKNIMNFDVVFKFGNPTMYDRYFYDSMISHLNNINKVTDAFYFGPYVRDSLPSKNGKITLSQSKALYPNEWRALELNVGFSTISNLIYSDNGSFVTDYFIDNNIDFSVTNIEKTSSLIKMYATQKLINNDYDSISFGNDLLTYDSYLKRILSNSLQNTLDSISNVLGKIDITETAVLDAAIDSDQSKIELYDMFKSLNDKWIAGGDYKNRTLFEDVLFLDRGSRNIGDKYLIDIFSLKNILNKGNLNMRSNVFLLISKILIQNNFTVMPMPSYINFYNVQSVDEDPSKNPVNITDFANDMWGTFLDVDYRKSGPKLVCFYVDKPSTYLSTLENKNYLFRDDAFNMLRKNEIPFLESQQNKNDWALSNKCVGFVVDIGTRNQNVFHGFSVAQDSGKATSESLDVTYQMGLQASGRSVATQNVSLYNIYKNLSYNCTIISMGNAMIQPTMYFNLQHVPLFNGPYFITEVTHTIGPGVFETTFNGTRQGIFTLPTIDRYLQSINENLLSKIEKKLNQKKSEIKNVVETNKDKMASIAIDANKTVQSENVCAAQLADRYALYVPKVAVKTTISPLEFANIIKSKTNDTLIQTMVYSACYVSSFSGNVFSSYNNNYANIKLTESLSPTDIYFEQTYMCIENSKKISSPHANFVDVNSLVDFVLSRVKGNVGRIGVNNIEEDLSNYIIKFFPTNRNFGDAEYEIIKNTVYPFILESVKESLKSAQSVGIDSLSERKVINLGEGDVTNLDEKC